MVSDYKTYFTSIDLLQTQDTKKYKSLSTPNIYVIFNLLYTVPQV